LDHWLTLPRENYLLVPFKPMRVAQISPQQSLTIPVDIFSHMNIGAVPRDRTLSYSTKDYGHWKTYLQYSQFCFTVDGGRTLRYRAKSEGGHHLEDHFIDDGMGFSWKSPKRQWLDEPFEWSPG
jgi:hypothetical protein